MKSTVSKSRNVAGFLAPPATIAALLVAANCGGGDSSAPATSAGAGGVASGAGGSSVAGASGAAGDGTGGAAAAGKEKGPCYGNGTCDAGLVCLSELCVKPDGAGGASGSPSGTGGASGSGGTAGGAAGSSGAGGSVPLVPCPPKIDLNCDPACGAITDTDVCAGTKFFSVTSLSAFPVVVRTLSKPGMQAGAKMNCPPQGKTAAIIRVSLDPWKGKPHHVRMRGEVGTWVVELNGDAVGGCISSTFGTVSATCETLQEVSANAALIATSDPGALPDNVTIDTTDLTMELPCP